MIKFYFKLQNKLLPHNLLYYLIVLCIIFNITIRVKPELFININNYTFFTLNNMKIIPIELFTFCDVYLLIIFIVVLIFLIGSDFNNSMADLTLITGGSTINKFALRKFCSLLLVYIPLYFCTYINIFTILTKLNVHNENTSIMPLTELLFYSFTTNFFIICFSMFILFLIKDPIISTVIIISYYFIEEALWRCKITQEYGILSHLYYYEYYNMSKVIIIKIIYLLLSLILLFGIYKIFSRRIGINIKKFIK